MTYWFKYSDKPISADGLVYRDQKEEPGSYTKPRGFWITDETEDWRSWCISERFQLDCLTHKHAIGLDETRILILRSAGEMDYFTSRYEFWKEWGGPSGNKWRDQCINWRAVADDYAGLIITPYQWSRRLEPYSWYYGWDCASGCIWDPSAITRIELIEIDHEVARQREAA